MLASTGDDEPDLVVGQDLPTEAATPRVLTIISHVMEKLVARNEWLAKQTKVFGKSLEAFHGVRAPSISIAKYLERIYKYTKCSPSCFVVGYAYIDRLAHKHPASLVVSLNVHRLLVTCVMIASKMLDDVHYNNEFYARVGGVSNADLNKMELELLFLLDFRVTVSFRAFESYCFHLEKEMLLNGNTSSLQDNGPVHETLSSASSLSSLYV
ncbi:hypothetical protein N665_1153s0018 [Sinapis alba]|nr:hypothetical protein N665_1153s0018 [Sinapis alba]